MVCSAYVENHAAAPPLALKDAKCEIAAEYTKKKNVIRLTLGDHSEYLFMTHDPVEMNQWQTKIQFHAGSVFSSLFSHPHFHHFFLLTSVIRFYQFI